MKAAKFQWQLPERETLPTEYEEWLSAHQLSPFLGKILWQRGYQTVADLESYFDNDLNNLPDPYLFFEMEKGVERIKAAVLSGEKIMIYGDYDADGITSTTVMKETLELLGADVNYFLPNRFKEGYGPNLAKYQEFVAEGYQLLITVDNGVSGMEAIIYAQENGLDVVVTDHHELPADLPPAYAIIHPRHPEGKYPFEDLAGVGVAFKVATALLEEVPAEFLDLVAIGTIADLVSLTGENRLLVKAGLKAIQQTERIGLSALIRKSGIEISNFSEGDIGFGIGPRLNAIGRLGDASPGVELMSTFDEEEAEQLADFLEEKNNQRKTIVEEMTAEALAAVDPANEIQLIAQSGWQEGVLGIVAGKILQTTGKPAILLTLKEDGTAKGSGRSVAQLNMFAMLDSMRELFTHFGGHHAAVGLTLPAENLGELQKRMNDYIRSNNIDLTQGGPLQIDEILQPEAATIALINELNTLAPFGTDNPIPTFLFKDVLPQNVKVIGANQQHLKFAVGEAADLDVLAFSFGAEANEFSGPIDVAGQLNINEWNGRKKPQVMLQDYQNEALQFFDWRNKYRWQEVLATESTLILAFQEASLKILPEAMKNGAIVYNNLADIQELIAKNHYQQLALVDVPKDLTFIKEILAAGSFSRIYFYGYSPDEAYLNGMGSREQFARLFKLVQQQEKIDVRFKLDQLVNYLKIPKSLLVFMIQVLSELKFVKIENGVLSKVAVTENQPLTASQLYQDRLQRIKNEEFLLLTDSEGLRKWLLA
ncbi:single-stranded-DNA-specific exonuclease RecJ [Enterococcus sp. LJL90]